MMNRKLLFLALWICTALAAWSQAPNGTGTYYQKTHGKMGRELKSAFFEVIKNPNVIDYDSLWKAYNTSDPRTMEGVEGQIIWDMYSGISRYPLYTYPHGTGTGSTEGEKGIQREHSMPKAWFNPTAKTSSKASKNYEDIHPLYSDLVHLIPTDAVCNNNRSDFCYGEIAEGMVEWESSGGFSKKSKQNGCATEGWAEQVANPSKSRVFEPNDEYKGDLARIYFYMVTCYEPNYFSWIPVRHTEIKVDNKGVEYEAYVKDGEKGSYSNNHCGTWTSDMFDAASEDYYQPFASWALNMLMRWSKEDPVSQKERDRNEAIWQFQGNRNPFVDYQGLENYIWGDKKEVAFDYGGEPAGEEPISENCEVALNKTTLGVDWSGTSNIRDYWTRTPITFEQNGITFTFSNGMEGRGLYADENELRLYNYHTLTLKAHNKDITKVEFTVTGRNNDGKTLVASEGEFNDNVWTGTANEVIFASNYVSSTKVSDVSLHYYLGLSNIKVTVATPTGITQKKTETDRVSPVYNLMGICLDADNLKPGIYVRNGRKLVVR